MKALYVWLLLATTAFAQIEVMPPESDAHDPITAAITNPIPRGQLSCPIPR